MTEHVTKFRCFILSCAVTLISSAPSQNPKAQFFGTFDGTNSLDLPNVVPTNAAQRASRQSVSTNSLQSSQDKTTTSQFLASDDRMKGDHLQS